MSTNVTTGKVRFSYANVFEPKKINNEGDPKFAVSLIIPKKDKVTLKKITDAIEEAIKLGVEKAWKGKKPPTSKLKLPLRDGDEERPEDEAYANAFFLNCNSKNRPGVVDADRNEILEPSEFYSGCFGRANINFYAFNVNGNTGIGVGLNHVQKLEDGDALGGIRMSAEDAFKDEDDIL